MKCIILKNLSTTKNIESLSFLNLGNPKTRSMNISIQGSLGTGKGVHFMHDFRLGLFTCYASITYSLNISFYVRPEKKYSCNICKVLAAPKCLIKPPHELPSQANHIMNI
jgi:hypothetical protein